MLRRDPLPSAAHSYAKAKGHAISASAGFVLRVNHFIAPMENVENLAADLMMQVRRHLNGVVAASLRRQGLQYPYCLGVSLPTLREIGKSYAPNQPLARLLLSRNMRESMLLASIVGDPRTHLESDTQLWQNTFIYSECVDVACADYLWKLRNANQLAYDWLFADEIPLQRAGIALLANCYRQTPQLAGPSESYSLEQLYARMVQLAATRTLFQPLLFLARWIARRGECDALLAALSDTVLPSVSQEARRELAECIRFEQL